MDFEKFTHFHTLVCNKQKEPLGFAKFKKFLFLKFIFFILDFTQFTKKLNLVNF
jgi:hypothetical protein